MLLLFALAALLSSCEPIDPSIKVALSKGAGSAHYNNYSQWLKKINPEIEYVDLYNLPPDSAIIIMKECSGLVLTGGPDVHPGEYNRVEDTARCSIDVYRDTLEFQLINIAKAKKLPILGICRGEQILNVAYGKNLVVDIPEDWVDSFVTHRCEDSENCFHDIYVAPKSQLAEICGQNLGSVNTNHHQAVKDLADVFVASAWSQDGIIEAYEWKNPEGKPFLMAVQWHPERMDFNSPFSEPIGKAFLEAVKNTIIKKN
ncbi:MAG: gamma-glutamyl-gamma-aminobutyrate hydrolase family protein [Candidatus Kapabacteria bacterium]|nr:gamma-glutamyl-gamma-aminobutyrate hydrolase family protein [Candidatus Kapabacteria bacterium]